MYTQTFRACERVTISRRRRLNVSDTMLYRRGVRKYLLFFRVNVVLVGTRGREFIGAFFDSEAFENKRVVFLFPYRVTPAQYADYLLLLRKRFEQQFF